MSSGPIETAYVEILPKLSPSFGADVSSAVSKALKGTDDRIKRSLSGVSTAIESSIGKPLERTRASTAKTADTIGGAIRQGIRVGLDGAERDVEGFTRDVHGKLSTATSKFSKVGDGIGESVDKGSRRARKSIGQIDTAATTSATRVERAYAGVGTKIAGVFAAAAIGSKAFEFAKGAIAGASDLNETLSKTNVILGDAGAKAADKFAQSAGAAFGQSRQQALDAISTFATFGKSAGLAGTELAGFSTDFAGLASDLASFHNTSPEEAINAIGAALRGESEPIRRYGILLDDASLRQEALRQGLIKTTKDALTPQQKVLASQALIFKQSKDAQGDFARTSDGLANQQRILAATTDNLQAKFGKLLLPASLAVVRALNNGLVPAVEKVGSVAKPLIGTVGKVGTAIGLLFGRGAKDAADGADGFAEVMDNVLGNSGKLVEPLRKVASTIQAVINGVQRSVQAVTTLFSGGGDAAHGFGELLDNALGNTGRFVAPLTEVGETILRTVDRVKVGVKDAITNAIGFVRSVAPIVQTYLVGTFHNVAGILTESVLPAIGRVANFVTGSLLPAVQDVGKVVAKNVLPVIRTLAKVFTENLQPAIATVYKQFSQNVLPVLIRVGEIFLKITVPIVKLAATIVGNLLPPLLRLVGPVLGGVIKVIAVVIGSAFQFIGALLNLGSTVEKIGSAIGGAFVAIGAAVAAGIVNVVRALAALPGKAVAALANLARFLGDLVRRAMTGFVDLARQGLERYLNLLRSLPGRAVGALGALGGALRDVLGRAFDGGLEIVRKAVSSVASEVGKLPGRITALGIKVFNAGKSLIGKLFDGIGSAVRNVGGFAADIGSAVKGAVNDALNLPLTIGPVRALGKTVVPKVTLLPRLARGGVFDRPLIAEIAEAGREAVVPATRRMGARAAKVIDQAGLLNIPQVQALVQRRLGTGASEGRFSNPLNRVGGSSSMRIQNIGGDTVTRASNKNVVVNASFNLAPMGSPQQHAQQTATRLAALMER